MTSKPIELDGLTYFGKHLIATARQCDERLMKLENISGFLSEVVLEIGMQPYGEPRVARYGEGEEVGITGVQLVQTSSITIHTLDHSRTAFIDIFSCRGYSEETALEFVRSCFAPREVSSQVLLRR
ncbi:MAG: S-adenosylmethionine decarboxylase [Acidobacteriota bacterium]